MRQKIAAANWKMNLTYAAAEQLVDDLLANQFSLQNHQHIILGVPFPYLTLVAAKVKNRSNIHVAAQNCYTKLNGAFTGETSVEMLLSIGIQHIIIGHSERREYFKEDNAMLAAKVDICLAHKATPIFCCGEPLPVREANEQNQYVSLQLKESLFHLTQEEIVKVVIAYEPIWAIGTGKTATSEQAQDIQAFIRSEIANKYSAAVANEITILYGGSVKASNAKELFSMPDVDGGLVGGASLVATEFAGIVNSLA
jgi:triosephosphate isomerase (TIM)